MRAIIFVVFLASAVASPGMAADTSAPAGTPQSDRLAALSAYAGTWKTETRHLDTPFSKAGSESATLRNDCWRSAGFYACNQFVDGESKALLVFLYDPAVGRYTSYPIPTGGGEVHPGSLIIEGQVWTFPWDYTEGGKTTHFRVVNVWSSPDSIEFRQEYSSDAVHWTLMADGHETRVK